jgi:signal transduction histidine kinase
MHLLFAALSVWLLWRSYWLIGVEFVLVASFVAGVGLLRSSFGTLDLVRSGARFIDEQDFSCKLTPSGNTEIDDLISVYNRMIDQLREERIRLEEQHYFLDRIVAGSPAGILTLDFDRRIDLVNPAAALMLGANESVLAGRRLEETCLPMALELERLPVGESRILAPRGRRRVKCSRSEFRDRGFQREFFVLEELTEELRQSEKAAYEKLIRLMSHEVNNTVTAANSLLHSCLNYAGQLGEADRRDYETALTAVIDRAAELNTFMRGFSEVARLPQPKRYPCGIRVLLEPVRMLMDAELCRRHISWNWDTSCDPGPVLVDRAQMEQVFVNIVRNAMEAIGEGGHITVRTGVREGRAFVAVEDNGPGIAPEHRGLLFTPFFSTKENGRGIGLTLIREVLENHGFDFTLESSPGTPTRFTIIFS